MTSISFLTRIGVAQARDGEAAGVQIAALAERHQFFDHRTKVLGLRQRGRDLLVLDERLRHVGEHRLAMLMRAIEAPLGASVIHRRSPLRVLRPPCQGTAASFISLSRRAGEGRGEGGADLSQMDGPAPHPALRATPHPALRATFSRKREKGFSSAPRTAWRGLRCCRAASQSPPCRGGGPSGPALP